MLYAVFPLQRRMKRKQSKATVRHNLAMLRLISARLSAPTVSTLKAQQSGDQNAQRGDNGHYPDTYKTPYHKTFSNESIYATPDAPHWEGNRLIDKDGNVISDEE